MSKFKIIKRESIEKIIKHKDAVKVISEKVTLTKRGKSLIGLCPFHDEKTGSFFFRPEHGHYHCFSCGESGNVIGFTMKVKGVGFTDAIKYLAKRFKIKLLKEE